MPKLPKSKETGVMPFSPDDEVSINTYRAEGLERRWEFVVRVKLVGRRAAFARNFEIGQIPAYISSPPVQISLIRTGTMYSIRIMYQQSDEPTNKPILYEYKIFGDFLMNETN